MTSFITHHAIQAAWTPKELAADKSWRHSLRDFHDELLHALVQFKSSPHYSNEQKSLKNGTILPTKDQFILPKLGQVLEQAKVDLEESRGVILLKDFPLQEDPFDNRLIYGGLLSYIGIAQPQTIHGERLQSVQDEGQAKLDERRGSKHNLGLPIHNDGCDVVGFLCTQQPQSGGETILVSAAAVHNAMRVDHPESLFQLYQPYDNAWQDYMYPIGKNTKETTLPRTWSAPIYSQQDGKMCCRYSRFYIDRAQSFPGIDRMEPQQLDALDRFDSYLNDEFNWQYRRKFNKGDVLFVNNHVVFHSRTAYIDGNEPEQHRHLFRAWMSTPVSRPLHDSMSCFFGNVGAGMQRGGVMKQFMLNNHQSTS